MRDLRLYNIWQSIRQKCYNYNNDSYKYYGGKGVVICKEWGDFKQFTEWSLQNGYSPEYVLSRKDTNGDYEPSNCKWITDQQHKAKRGVTGKVEYIDYMGKILTLAELSKIVNISFNTLRSRYLAGRRGETLVMKPDRRLRICV